MDATKPDNQSTLSQIESLLHELRASLLIDSSSHNEISQEMSELERSEIITASLYLHQGKYAYAVSPMVNGRRCRRYIGSDTTKILAAEAAIARGIRYQELTQRKKIIEHRIAGFSEDLESVLRRHRERAG
jgi:hypothetical protein